MFSNVNSRDSQRPLWVSSRLPLSYPLGGCFRVLTSRSSSPTATVSVRPVGAVQDGGPVLLSASGLWSFDGIQNALDSNPCPKAGTIREDVPPCEYQHNVELRQNDWALTAKS